MSATFQMNNSALRNLKFGVARGLTQIAKNAQADARGAVRSTFTVRNTWVEQSNKFGIKVKPAKKEELTAAVHTKADWLEMHEEGGIKRARQGQSIVIPTTDVKRNQRAIITRANRPKGLGTKAFVIHTSRGKVLVQRKKNYQNNSTDPRWKNIRFLYWFESSVRIKRQSTFYQPIARVVRRRGLQILAASIRSAMA